MEQGISLFGRGVLVMFAGCSRCSPLNFLCRSLRRYGCVFVLWFISIGIWKNSAFALLFWDRDESNPVLWEPPSVLSTMGYDPADGRRETPRSPGGVVVPLLIAGGRLRRAREWLVCCEPNLEVRGALRSMYEELEANLGACLKARGDFLEALNQIARRWVGRFVRRPGEGLRFRVLDFYVVYWHTQLLNDTNYRMLWRYLRRSLLREGSCGGGPKCIEQRAIFRSVFLYEIQLPVLEEKSWEWLSEYAVDYLATCFFGTNYKRLSVGLRTQVDHYVWVLERHWRCYAAEVKLAVAVP